MQNGIKTVETVCKLNTPEDEVNNFVYYSHMILVSDNYVIGALHVEVFITFVIVVVSWINITNFKISQ